MSLRRNLTANYLGQAWVGIMGLAFLPLYARYLGSEGLGLIGVYSLLQAWLTLLDLGITPTLNREMARFTAGAHSAQSVADLMRSVETVGGLLAGLIALSLWLASSHIATNWLRVEGLPIPVVSQALAAMGLVVALRFFEGIYRSALLGLQRQVFYNVLNALLATARFGGAVAVLAWISPTILAFYVWQAMVSLVGVAALALTVRRILPVPSTPPRVSREALREVRGFAGGMLTITSLSLLVSQVDKVVLSRILSLEDFGYYTLAATLGGGLTMAIAPILQSIYPRLVELATIGAADRLAATYHQGAQLVTFATVPAMLVLTVFPWGVVYAWSGQAPLAGATAPLLTPLALGSFLNALMWMPYQSQLAHGWTSLTIRVNVVAVVVIVPAILFLVPQYGAQAAGWIWVALNAAYVIVAVHFMHQRILPGELRRWYVDDIGIPLVGAVVVVIAMRGLTPADSATRLVWVGYLVTVGLASGVATLILAGTLRPRAVLLGRRLNLSARK